MIGVIGGIGSGKSAVSRWVAEHHPVALIDADRLGHAALLEPAICAALVAEFGSEILDAAGNIDRRRLAGLVFGDSEPQRTARAQLEAIVHPAIRRGLEAQLQKIDPDQYVAVLVDAALLLEAHWDQYCQAIAYIDTPDEDRQERVLRTRGWTAADLAARERSQWPNRDKRARASHVVANAGELADSGVRLWKVVESQLGGKTQ